MKRLLIAVIILSALPGFARAADQSKRNPFAPLAKTTIRTIPGLVEPVEKNKDSEAVQLKLNGIIWGKNRPVAIINDTVVEIGSIIAGRRVSAISISQVELQYYDKKEILRITPKFLFTISNNKLSQNTKRHSESVVYPHASGHRDAPDEESITSANQTLRFAQGDGFEFAQGDGFEIVSENQSQGDIGNSVTK